MQLFRNDNKTSYVNDHTEKSTSTSIDNTQRNVQDEYNCPKYLNNNNEVSVCDDLFEDVSLNLVSFDDPCSSLEQQDVTEHDYKHITYK